MRCTPKGPIDAEILIVGEAPGKEEDVTGVPFVGTSGKELDRMLEQAGLAPRSIRMTNVFQTQPPNNDMNFFCGKRSDVSKTYPFPQLAQGKWVLEKHLGELARLEREVEETNPRLIIALGNTAVWALLKRTGITKLRGTVFSAEGFGQRPVLPTFHPAAILRQWSDRTVAVTDFIKAKRFITEGLKQTTRYLTLDPTFDEVQAFLSPWLSDSLPQRLSLDIETRSGTITCIGFSATPERSICIPFYDPTRADHNYWPTAETEIAVWKLVKAVCENSVPKLGQNGLYDLQYLARCGIFVNNYRHDTMIRHHSLLPEMPKSLGFLASVYTDEANWKVLRDRNRDNFKIDDE